MLRLVGSRALQPVTDKPGKGVHTIPASASGAGQRFVELHDLAHALDGVCDPDRT